VTRNLLQAVGRVTKGLGWSPQRSHLYLFLHLPKCAGTTIIRSLRRVGYFRYVRTPTWHDAKHSKQDVIDAVRGAMARKWVNASTVDVILGHSVFYGLDEISERPAFYFTFLRDPVSRYVSLYRFLVDCAFDRSSDIHEGARKLVIENGKAIGLGAFAERGYTPNDMTRRLAAANHPDRMIGSYVHMEDKELLELAADFLRKMSFIGLVEDLDHDLSEIADRLQVSPLRGRLNQSHSPAPLLEDSGLLRRIRENNQLDLQIYDIAKRLRRQFVKPSLPGCATPI
jgi:Sulfotransferase family